ncbi:MAG: ABC transporter ATP-binding protein [Alphaproteobacteria bacterium]|nr:ABC transporter ATP-binding protein [Alphaproteobacteria bacterium]
MKISASTAPGGSGPALAVAGVSHRFGERRVLERIDLKVDPGELVCLVGPSGCGKTTLLRLAAGLEDLQAGSIAIDGCAIAEPGYSLPAENRGVGFVFQDYALFPHLDVAGNVAFGIERLRGAARDERIATVLRQVGMQDYSAAYPHQLSGGQQQRVALARALAPRPRVLLLDEPFSGLDARLREQIRDDTLHVLKDSGAATLMVTHDPEEAMFMADRLVVMNAGRIEQAGRPAEVYSAPASAFVAAFFGQVNEVVSEVRDRRVTTPFGAVPAEAMGEGTRVRVLIRPEALKLRLTEIERACPAKVLAARLLGRSSWIHLCLGAQPGTAPETSPAHLHFHARVPGRFLPQEGLVLGVELDTSQAFVFPADPSI